MPLFVLDEFEMALSWSEKLVRKRKARATYSKRIMKDPKLYAVAKQKKR